jgi:hypothetical protein
MTMSNQSATTPPANEPPTPMFNLGPGLLEYYSSQAELMLAQVDNINRLLGPTRDWTHPGDFCEILFRDFLRRFLPPSLSADKGFFYGRATLDGEDTHCPEIDILIHDTQQYRPIFRMGDFVIVQPQSVRGMIQVKRTFSQDQVKQGIENVVCAKQHLLNVLWKDNPKGWSNWGLPPCIFSAVVGFKDKIGGNTSFFHENLIAQSVEHRIYDRPGMEQTSMYVLPSFMGSLHGSFVISDGPCNYWNQRYFVLDSKHDNANVCIQAFLAKIYNVLGGDPTEMPPFSFPQNLKPVTDFHVLSIIKVVCNPDNTLTLHRNDNWMGQYRKTDGPANDVIHLIADDSSSLKVADRLKVDIAPRELFMQRSSGVERYELIEWAPSAKGTN